MTGEYVVPDLELSTAPSGGAETAPELIERLLERAERRGELGVGATRGVLLAMMLTQHLVLYGRAMLAGDPREIGLAALLVVGLLATVALVVLVRRTDRLHALSLASVALDALFIQGALLMCVIWPWPGYSGLLAVHWTSIVYLAVIAAAMRFSTAAAALGIVANGVGYFALLVGERLFRPDYPNYLTGDVGLSVMLFAGFSVLTWNFGGRARRLVLQSAQAIIHAERVRQRLGAYVSEEVAQHALRHSLRLGGQRQDIAVLFCDLRGFTAYSERLAPERLVAELNGYLQAMVGAIRAERGVVDKYIGDSVMAVFGIPSAEPDAAARAIRAAAAMCGSLREHNDQRARAGLAPLKHGIGVHFGPAVAGNIGTAERMQYTVVGDTVNLASRLEAATKDEGVEVLISAQAVEAARRAGGSHLALARHGLLRVRGHEGEIEVFTLAAPVQAVAPVAPSAQSS